MKNFVYVTLLWLSLYSYVQAGNVFNDVPETVSNDRSYIIYSHGYIVEGDNPKPVHAEWGEYDYPGILNTLSELDSDVISLHRPNGSDPHEHAQILSKYVAKLLNKGVNPHKISLIGFSRGGFITAIASSLIQHPDINYVILAACTSGLSRQKEIVLTGNLLSIYETSDTVGSCQDVVKRKPMALSSFKEYEISTGNGHGAFYRPRDEWIVPIKQWLKTHVETGHYEVPRSSVIELKELNTQRTYPIYIQLPRSYQTAVDRQYPVIYVTDAPYSFPIVTGATRYPMNAGLMEEAIIVGIGYEKGSKGQSSRVRDYTPVLAENWKMQTGNADGHLDFIRSSLFQFIETKYRTDPSKRIFMGHSLGGLFGVYTLLTSPTMFSSYILGSPSVWFNNDYLLQLPLESAQSFTKVYVAVGEFERPQFGEGEDMVLGAQSLAKKIKSAGDTSIEPKLVIIDEATHATSFPTTAIQGLDWILGKKKSGL